MITMRTYRSHLRCRLTGENCRALRARLPADRRTANSVHTLRFTSYRRDADSDGARYAMHYFDQDPDYVILERRTADAQVTATLTEAECRALLVGDTDWLLSRQDPMLREFHASIVREMLLPRILLTYQREYYTLEDGKTWVALNTDIRTTLEHMDFLNPEQLVRLTAGQEGEHILEVVCREDMPEDLRRLLREAVPDCPLRQE